MDEREIKLLLQLYDLIQDRARLRDALRQISQLQEHDLTDAWSIALRAIGDEQSTPVGGVVSGPGPKSDSIPVNLGGADHWHKDEQ